MIVGMWRTFSVRTSESWSLGLEVLGSGLGVEPGNSKPQNPKLGGGFRVWG